MRGLRIKRRHLTVASWAGVLTVLGLSRSYWGWDSVLGSSLFSIGVILIGCAVSGRLWVLVYHSGYKKEVLLTEGPYSLCRNPLYLCNFLGAIGVGLTTATLSVPIFAGLCFAAIYPVVIRREERNLRALHGPSFDRYRAELPALVPAWGHLREPDVYSVNVRAVRGRMLHATWPLAGIAVIHVIRSLHVHDALPVLFRLY
jgi:protein-S-isoprenylcysteine O-methyltransferase Ste14